MHKTSKTEASIENIYRLEGRVPVAKAIPFGLQHILAMFVANIAPIIIVAAACGLSASESAGLGRDATTKETSGSIACDGFVSALSSVFGCLPITSFSQNVGLVAMTKVVNRFTIATGAVIMDLSGNLPDLRRCACNIAGCGTWRLYDHDVRYDCRKRYPDAWQMWLYTEKHYDYSTFLKYRSWIYTGAGDFRNLPSYCPDGICRKLRRCCIYCRNHSESCTSEEHGGTYD